MTGSFLSPRRSFVFAVVLAAFGTGAPPAHAQVWVGTGFDMVSQKYYLVAVDTIGLPSDSLDRLRQLATELSEGNLSIRTCLGDGLSWDQTTAVTSLSWHHRTALVARSDRKRNTRGGLEYHLDWKSPHEESETNVLSNFLVHKARAEGEQAFGAWAVRLRGDGEWVDYPDGDEFIYDYRHYRGDLRLRRRSGFFSDQELRLSLGRRHVPDSTRVSYWEPGVEFAFNALTGEWSLFGQLQLAERRYDSDAAGLDFSVGRMRVEWHDGALPSLWSGSFQAEGYNYYSHDGPISDFTRWTLRQRRAFPTGTEWSPYIEPGLEVVFADLDLIDESYTEPGVTAGIDYLALNGWWGNGDISLSRRNYGTQDVGGFNDYWRFGINLLVDGHLYRNITGNLLLSQDWEWHADDTDDIAVTLFSVGLRYQL